MIKWEDLLFENSFGVKSPWGSYLLILLLRYNQSLKQSDAEHGTGPVKGDTRLIVQTSLERDRSEVIDEEFGIWRARRHRFDFVVER